MAAMHIGFVLYPAYGHVLPTLSIATELIRRGHRVSYAITESFAPAIVRAGARPVIIDPPEIREEICHSTALPLGGHDFRLADPATRQRVGSLRQQRTAALLLQLEARYADDPPDVVVHDDCLDSAGRTLAQNWSLAHVRFCQIPLQPADLPSFAADQTVILPIPRFFNNHSAAFDDRFHFVGFIPDARHTTPRPPPRDDRKVILAAPTTGLLPQLDFCNTVVHAIRESEYTVVLSVPGSLDPLSTIGAAALGSLPANFVLNTSSPHVRILQDAQLFIGQGGPGSTLEAVYSGVPSLLVPPTQDHDRAATRIAELGLGMRLSLAEASPEQLRSHAIALISDSATLARVRDARDRMRSDRGATAAADLIEGRLA
jgi:UDP:flavonoid glycosyltransferase YjiC (YdhE family)